MVIKPVPINKIIFLKIPVTFSVRAKSKGLEAEKIMMRYCNGNRRSKIWSNWPKTAIKKALESLIRRIQDRVYGLALRMLGHPADAEDAVQEILVKVVTHIDSFRQESTFATWVYRVAANHLLTTRKRLFENQAISFEEYESFLENRECR
jgi:hypothetical protein